MKAKCVRKDNFPLTIQLSFFTKGLKTHFVSIHRLHITESHYYVLFVPPSKDKVIHFPTNEMSDFIDMSSCARLSLYIDFRQERKLAENP